MKYVTYIGIDRFRKFINQFVNDILIHSQHTCTHFKRNQSTPVTSDSNPILVIMSDNGFPKPNFDDSDSTSQELSVVKCPGAPRKILKASANVSPSRFTPRRIRSFTPMRDPYEEAEAQEITEEPSDYSL